KYQMNWIREDAVWGKTILPYGMTCSVERETVGDGIVERYTFKNTLDRYIFTHRGSVAICTPFPDSYPDTKTCIGNRCHTHICCAEDASYVMALRMGGEAPHLGLALTRGSLSSYRVERDFAIMSNDRGIFWLQPSPTSLAPGESFTVEWALFWHEGKEDFLRKLRAINPRHMDIKADAYTLFSGEPIRVTCTPAFAFDPKTVKVTCGERTVPATVAGGTIRIEEDSAEIGERRYDIYVGDVRSHCTVLVLPTLQRLSEARCRFIAEKQQFRAEGHPLDGAYLTYDNEEKHVFYARANDFNSARERVGMGLLMARYIKHHPDASLRKSLDDYMTFIEREIVDVQTGDVANDYGRRDPYKRLYNYPWLAELYLEMYDLDGHIESLLVAYRILDTFYRNGGHHFYAFEIPVVRILRELKKAGLSNLYDALLADFRIHAETMLQNGVFYPAHEVNFEQSIVAPAATFLIQMYRATGEEKYLAAAREHRKLLELFDGIQPEWNLNMVAIRHWDGYWFGKRKLLGDTLPHYWSALSGVAYRH
ncbi:MAG: hypothetical protein IKU90_00210, partial [Clostridia bacterium]|nr:hypothetical protein [Clostridia bacterium]